MNDQSADSEVWVSGNVDNVNKQFLCDKFPPYKCKWTEFKRPGVFGVAKWLYEGSRATIPKEEELDRELPIIKTLKLDGFDSEETGNGIRVTWLGHACVLVQIGGMKILTDPVFSTKCGPKFKYQIGNKRYRDAPCTIERLSQMAQIDAVVISHNHYDHLDSDSVCQLAMHFPNLRWFVPLGVKAFMESCKCKNVEECSWWEYWKLGDVQVTFVPAQHWSKRGLMDGNMTLWGGWCVKGPQGNFYFTGDTGYDDKLFKEIRDKLGPFDLAAIPIGAYCPRWFMSRHHVDPEEALKIHEDVEAKKSIGIHWGTFNLSSEPILEPRNRIIELQIKKEIEALEKDKIEDLRIKKIEDWLNKQIKELPKEIPEEWLKKKIEELKKGKSEKLHRDNVEEFEELWRKKIEEWLSKKIEEMWKEKIEEWLRKKIREPQKEEINENQKSLRQNFEKWLNKMIEELHEVNAENLQKEKPEEGKKIDEFLKKKFEKLRIEKIEERLRKIIEELKIDEKEISQKERLEECLKNNIEELHKENTDKSQESLEEWLRKKIEKMQKDNLDKVEVWLREKTDEVLLREEIEDLPKKEIDDWQREKMKELEEKKLTNLQASFDFFTISIGESKFIKNEKKTGV